MTKAIEWAKQNKVVILLLAIVAFLLIRNSSMMRYSMGSTSYGDLDSPESMGVARPALVRSKMAMDAGSGVMSESAIMPPTIPGESVDISQSDRMVVRNASVSLLVKDVQDSINQINQHASSVGGIMVNSSANTPSEGGSGYISIRVPAANLTQSLEFLRAVGVRVVSENIDGNDVTDQYTDTEARLATLNTSKTSFEAMMARATTVEETLKVQNAILDVQNQIDSIKGQLDYLKKTSESSLITVYLSTDELALPYSPSEPWRPQVVFKMAVRSLTMTIRSIADMVIWGVVYLPVFAVIGAVGWFGYKVMNKPKQLN